MKTEAILFLKGPTAGVGGTKRRALVTGYFQPLIAVVLLMSPLGLPPALPAAGQGWRRPPYI